VSLGERCEGQFVGGCGQKVNVRTVHLSKTLVNGLRACHQAYVEGRPFIISEIKKTSGSEYTHFYNLKYFGLVEKVLTPEGLPTKEWRITNLGIWFLNDWEDAPERAYVARGDRLLGTEGKVSIKDVRYVEVTRESVIAEMLPFVPPGESA